MKHGLWSAQTSHYQRGLVVVFMAVLLGALVPMLSRSFVPHPQGLRWAWLGAAALTALGGGALWHGWRRNLWRPAGPWLHYSRRKRWLMAPLCGGFFLFLLWLNLGITVPMLYTRLAGTEVDRITTVQKKNSTGRRSCRHQLALTGVRYWLFEFCIDPDAFAHLPDGPLPATVHGRSSALGVYWHRVQFAAPSASPAVPHGTAETAP